MLFGIPEDYHIILASRSPRRHQLLSETGLSFETLAADYDERHPDGMTGREIAEFLSAKKAEHIRERGVAQNTVVITADTIVWCSGKVLDKPADYIEAFEILRTISGRTHEVITGVSFLSYYGIHTFSDVTRVTFDQLPDEVIDYYIRTFKPFDKAGAYGIQEWIGIVGNSSVEGSYFNVMGLPVNRLIKELREYIRTINENKII